MSTERDRPHQSPPDSPAPTHGDHDDHDDHGLGRAPQQDDDLVRPRDRRGSRPHHDRSGAPACRRERHAVAAPISQHFDFAPLSVEVGDVVLACTPDESAHNRIGMVHGGLVCTLLDTVTGCAVHTTLPAGTAHTSLEIKVSCLRAISLDTGPLTAHGWVTRAGRRAAFVEGDVRDASGKVLATASSTCLVTTP